MVNRHFYCDVKTKNSFLYAVVIFAFACDKIIVKPQIFLPGTVQYTQVLGTSLLAQIPPPPTHNFTMACTRVIKYANGDITFHRGCTSICITSDR